MRNLSDELLVRHCAPTLAGIKTGSLFRCEYENRKDLVDELRKVNRVLKAKKIFLIPLCFSETTVLLYMFRPEKLKKDLACNQAKEILKNCGYNCENCGVCLKHLIRKLKEESDFPHEIGLFLSYPPKDVYEFIKNGAENYKCVGEWKAYSNERKAIKTFNAYRKCKRIYKYLLKNGKSLEQLAVIA